MAKSVSAAAAAQRNLGLGFSVPIVAGVVALILGLIVSDATRTMLDIWIWVLIHLILGLGVVLGTRFATASFNFGLARGAKLGAAKGARNLNLVLGIVWSSIVIITSFTKAMEAVQRSVVWPYSSVTGAVKQGHPIKPTIEPFTSVQFWQSFLPAFVLLVIACVGIFLLLSERAREPRDQE